MCAIIAIKGDRYYYWFNSDAGGDNRRCLTGNFEIAGDLLKLGTPGILTDLPAIEDPSLSLYSTSWRMIREEHRIVLLAEHDKPEDTARRLIPDFHFDPENPFRNQEHLEAVLKH